jgi:hypothetical protein
MSNVHTIDWQEMTRLVGKKSRKAKKWILDFLSSRPDKTANHTEIMDSFLDAPHGICITTNALSNILTSGVRGHIECVGHDWKADLHGYHYKIKRYRLIKELKGVKLNER